MEISKELAERIMQYIEECEELIDGEFGECRDFEEIVVEESDNEGVLIYKELKNEIRK